MTADWQGALVCQTKRTKRTNLFPGVELLELYIRIIIQVQKKKGKFVVVCSRPP